VKRLTDYFKEFRVNSVLDVGTGSGDFISVLKDVFPTAQLTGIDPNTDSLQEAAQTYPDVVFKNMGGENLELEDKSFDVASISMALHHLPDISKTLIEMKRVVKPRGWIIVNELFSDNLNPAQEVHKMFHHFRSSVDRLTGVSHNETFNKQEILNLVENSGIEIQFHFEFNKNENLNSKPEDVELRVDKMIQMLDPIKDTPEFEQLQPKIDEFREAALKHGFQQPTKVVIVGKVN
jgi:SAM-dependent methyltransferase